VGAGSLDERGTIEALGACCFRWRDFTLGEQPYPLLGPCYVLSWIWLHPYIRRHGCLEQAWPYFVERFGDFIVETPLSTAMHQFLIAKTRYNDVLAKFDIPPLRPSERDETTVDGDHHARLQEELR
jgi:hypothetical protein